MTTHHITLRIACWTLAAAAAATLSLYLAMSPPAPTEPSQAAAEQYLYQQQRRLDSMAERPPVRRCHAPCSSPESR